MPTTDGTGTPHPLRVAELPLGDRGGCIGLGVCPGKHDGALPRDLSLDLAALRHWGASAVLTLLQVSEFELLRVPDLGLRVQAAGMNWLHAPVADFSVPDDTFLARWPLLCKVLLARVARGERVFIHCRGGLGRSGLVAALVLIEAGTAPAAALLAVRGVRPGAVETAEQERFVLGYGHQVWPAGAN
jgi:protein-tyrosine phosphatase